MIGMLGVLLALGLLTFLTYRGVSVLLLGTVMALIAALFAVGTPLLATYTQVFMNSAGHFIVQFFRYSCSARSSASCWPSAG